MKRRILAVLSCSALITFTAHAQPGPVWQSTTYKGQEIGKLTGDVYYARTDDYVSAFMVTRDGIVLVEPAQPRLRKPVEVVAARRVADRHDDRHGLRPQPPRHEAEDQRRGRVEPLRVVDEADERP